MGDFAFPKHFHLRRPSEFSRVYDGGRKKHTRGFIVFHLPNGLEYPRLGLSVSRKFGGAVTRNRIKRLVREALRLNWRSWKLSGRDIIVIPKRSCGASRLVDVTSDFTKAFAISKKGG